MDIENIGIIDVPQFKDQRGCLSSIEKNILPFEIKRVFYLYNITKNSFRGRHAHIEHLTFLIALNGSFDVTLIDTNNNKKIITLDKPTKGLFVPNMIWHELNNFSKGAVCLVLASDEHKEEDYILDFNEFLKS